MMRSALQTFNDLQTIAKKSKIILARFSDSVIVSPTQGTTPSENKTNPTKMNDALEELRAIQEAELEY